jgi:ferrous iron transport protein A
MGVLPGNTVELLQIAPLGSLIFEHCSHLAIRVETAQEIEVELIKIFND